MLWGKIYGNLHIVVGATIACQLLPLPLPNYNFGGIGMPEIDIGKSDNLTTFWYNPHLCFNETCVYSPPPTAYGTSLVTNRHQRHIFRDVQYETEVYEDDSEPFFATDISGKGTGLVATRDISKGEIVMVQIPSLVVQASAHISMADEERELLYSAALETLPGSAQREFNNQFGNSITDKINKNGFTIYLNGERYIACVPKMAKMNHDCRPNVHYEFNGIQLTSRAMRRISEGQELTDTYIRPLQPRVNRQHQLLKWGFSCTCTLCKATDDEVAESDSRIAVITQLIQDLTEKREKFDAGSRLVDLVQQERLDAYLGLAYTRAALSYARFGDKERTISYAKYAVEAITVESGADHTDALNMKRLAENPEGCADWARFKSSRGS
ncbi:SET domain-containing protein [Xylaria telfairii]|nr:SET domain-containing protein [Xylaria telfairii]